MPAMQDNFNVQLAQRVLVPLARLREITSDLPACGLSRMASRSIRAGERVAGGLATPARMHCTDIVEE